MELPGLLPVFTEDRQPFQQMETSMAIQQSQSRVESTEPFPANENSTYPSKSTVNSIIYTTILIALFGVLLGLANSHLQMQDNSVQAPVMQPQIREPAPNAGAHDQ